ncbi:hypothetical protein ACRAWF_30160 [Streptomyces sp. L7]
MSTFLCRTTWALTSAPCAYGSPAQAPTNLSSTPRPRRGSPTSSDGCGGGSYNGALAFTKEEGLTAKVPKGASVAWHKQVMERATAEPTSS